MCLEKLCVHKKTFQTLSSYDYQCPQGVSLCQVRNFELFHLKKNKLLCLMSNQRIDIFEKARISIRDVIGDMLCSKCENENCV